MVKNMITILLYKLFLNQEACAINEVNQRMNDWNRAKVEEKFRIRSKQTREERKKELSIREKGRAVEKDIVNIPNGFFVLSGIKREEFRSSLKVL